MAEWLRAADGNGGPLAHRGHRGDCLGRLILSQRRTGGISSPLTTCGQSRGDCRSSRPSGKAVVCILPSPLAAMVSTSIARAKQLPATSHDSPGSQARDFQQVTHRLGFFSLSSHGFSLDHISTLPQIPSSNKWGKCASEDVCGKGQSTGKRGGACLQAQIQLRTLQRCLIHCVSPSIKSWPPEGPEGEQLSW